MLFFSSIRKWPLPLPSAATDKEGRGHVLVIAGSREIPGAAILAATGAMRVGAGQGCRVTGFNSLGQQEQAHRGPAFAEPAGRLGPFVGPGRGHSDVDQRDVWLVMCDRLFERPRVPHEGARFDTGFGQEAGEPLAPQDGVVRDHDPHGSTALIVVP